MLATPPVAPLSTHQTLVFLLQIGLLLLLAILLGRLAGRAGLPAIVGELSAGVLLGPSLFGWLAPGISGWLLPARADQAHLLDAVGQVAVLLLVGLTGIEMDLRMVRRRSVTVLRISLAGLLVPLASGILLGYPLSRLLGTGSAEPATYALFLGVAMSVSAIPVIAKTLLDMNLIHRNVGQLTLAAGMVDDAFGWLMLSIVSAMAVGGLNGGRVGLALAHLLFVLAFALLLGRPIVRLSLGLSRGSDEQTVATAAALILLSGAGTHALGLEAVFGAFVCGVLIGSSGEFARARTASLRTVVLAFLSPIFFASAGLRIDLRGLADPAVLAAGAIVLSTAITGKFAGAYLGARLSRLSRWEAFALGAGMNARGVIEIIVAMVGLRLGILDTDTYTIVVLVAVVTSIMAPPLLRLAMRRIDCTPEEELRLVRGLSAAPAPRDGPLASR